MRVRIWYHCKKTHAGAAQVIPSSIDCSNIMAEQANHTYREGGWGWAVVFATFLAYFIGYGTMKGFGVLITAITDDFRTDLWIIGTITNVYIAVQFVLVPVAAAASRKVGLRFVICFGGVLYSAGLILASVSRDVTVFTGMIVMAAAGAACVLEPIRAAVAFYFQEKYSQATFVAASGDPVGMMVYGPLTHVLLNTYGWRGTMLIFGSVGCHFIFCGMLTKTPTRVYKVILTNAENTANEEQQPGKKRTGNCISSFLTRMDLEFLVMTEFILIMVSHVTVSIPHASFVVYMVSNAIYLGLSSSQASFLTVPWGVGYLVGWGIAAVVLQRKLVSSHAVAAVFGVISVTCLVVNNFVTSFVGQMLIVAGTASGPGCIFMVTAILLRNMPVDDDQFISIFCWRASITGGIVAIGGVITGWLYDVTGSFQAPLFWLGTNVMMSVAFIFLHSYYLSRPSK